MKVITMVFSFLSTLAGLGLLGYAFIMPGGFPANPYAAAYSTNTTDLYMISSHFALLGIGALLFALLCIANAAQSQSIQIIQQAKQPPTGAPARYNAN